MKELSFSQCGQDRFVRRILPPQYQPPRYFLDVGCSHPFTLSNTAALEAEGWRGWMVDTDTPACLLCAQKRTASVIIADATKYAFDALPVTLFDYLSLDVDSATLATLQNLVRCGVRFKVATVEHDSYQNGPGPRDAMREILRDQGYDLLCKDVLSPWDYAKLDGPTVEFEDWWIDRTQVDTSRADSMRCSKVIGLHIPSL